MLIDLAHKFCVTLCTCAAAFALIEVIGLATGAYSMSMPHKKYNGNVAADVWSECNRREYQENRPCTESLMKMIEDEKARRGQQ